MLGKHVPKPTAACSLWATGEFGCELYFQNDPLSVTCCGEGGGTTSGRKPGFTSHLGHVNAFPSGQSPAEPVGALGAPGPCLATAASATDRPSTCHNLCFLLQQRAGQPRLDSQVALAGRAMGRCVYLERAGARVSLDPDALKGGSSFPSQRLGSRGSEGLSDSP